MAPTGAFAQVAAQPSPQAPGAIRAPLSDTVLRSAVANADFRAFSLLRSATPAPSAPAGVGAPFPAPVRSAGVAPNGRDLDCMTQAVYYEAKGEPLSGQAAVAQVVLNRVRHPAFPKSVCGVVFQRAGHSCQFSWACHRPSGPGESGQWAQARAVAARVMAGEVIAGIGFATHFNGVRARGFGSGLQRVAAIGGHAFYRFVGAKGSGSMFSAPLQFAKAAPAPSDVGPRTVYASFLPMPPLGPKVDASRLLASASTAMHSATASASSAVQSAAASASSAVHTASASVQSASAVVRQVVTDATQSAAQTIAVQAHLAPAPKLELIKVAPSVALAETTASATASAQPSPASHAAPAEEAKPATIASAG